MTQARPPAEFEIDLLRCFSAVIMTGSFTAAGELIGLSQSAASLRIKRLEERIGGSLLVRDPRRVSLTELGERFLPDAVELLNTHDRIVARHSVGNLSAVGVGIDETVPERLLPACFNAFEVLDLPRPTFRMSSTLKTVEEVMNQSLELGLVWSSANCPWGGHAICETKVVWVASRELDVADLDLIPIVSHTPSTYIRDRLRERRTRYATVFESANLHACYQAVKSGIGVSVAAKLAVPWLEGCRQLSDPRLPESDVMLRLIVADDSDLPSRELAAALKSEVEGLLHPTPKPTA